MKKSGSKIKGNALENNVARFYNRKLDKFATRMPLSGAAEGFKGDIQKRFRDGWTDECKSRAAMSIYDFWKQASDQAGELNKPVLHIKANNKEILTVIRINDYFDMREELEDWRNMKDNLESEIKEKNHWNKTSGENKILTAIQLIKDGLKLINKD